jgi:hypothetical protein
MDGHEAVGLIRDCPGLERTRVPERLRTGGEATGASP